MMNKVIYKSVAIFALAGIFLIADTVPTALAANVSYDRYAAVYEEEPAEASALHRISTGLLTYPFEPIRYVMDRTLYTVEKNHLDDKAIWIYDTIKNQGITPKLGLLSPLSPKFGAEFDLVRIARQKQTLPDLTAQTYINFADDIYWNTGARLGLDRIMDTELKAFTWAKYEYREQEHFYGIGPNTSKGEGGIYSREETTVGASLGYGWDEEVQDIEGVFAYHNVNISEGRDGGRKQIRALFPAESRLSSDSLLELGLTYRHDTRNHKGNSTKGGLRSLSVGYFEGLDNSKARFLRYQTEISQYFSLGSPRRVLAVRMFGEHNDELNGGTVPFHQMPRLGGFGMHNRLSHTLRGYEFNRFTDESALLFNLEYRYAIWEYRDFRLDSVLFWDQGQVFSEISNFKFDNFRESYGLGFRLGLANITVFSVELAHGDEGTNFYVKTETPF